MADLKSCGWRHANANDIREKNNVRDLEKLLEFAPMATDCWIVTDGARGNEKQCQALAYYLAQIGAIDPHPPSRFRLSLAQPWDALAPRLTWRAGAGFRTAANADSHCADIDQLTQHPPPKLLISCGRRAALVARVLKKRSGSVLTTVQILNPRIHPRHFDWVVCPRHDGLSGNNVIATDGALHNVDEETLKLARNQWPELANLGQPRVAVLVGASNGAYQIDRPYLERLLSGASQLAGRGTLMVTTSRRTPSPLQDFVRDWLTEHLATRFLLHADQPALANPYSGLLAYADRIVVSSDSVNMISEALGTGRPVHCLTISTKNQRFSRFQGALLDSGRLSGLDDPGRSDYPPLRETVTVAHTIAPSLPA
ncbi:MAG: mitochondrial fission ELM1 family protein [Lysobacterales bacterium]